MIRPSQAQPLLPRKLRLRRAVTPHPVVTLGREEDVARPVSSHIRDRRIHQSVHLDEPIHV